MFDDARVAQQLGREPRLPIIAHRKEILNQAFASFRCLVWEQNFGDLFVDVYYLFCLNPRYNSRSLKDEEADRHVSGRGQLLQ